MKKRLSAFFLAFVLLCPMLTIPAAADVTVYITENGTKYHTATCSSLRKSKIAISLTEAKKRGYTACKICNPPTSSTHTHSWNSGKVTKAATCTAAGTKTYTCTTCGATKQETIPATGHNWNSGVVTTTPTETSDGVRTITCTRCKATKTSRIPAIGYPFEDVPSNSYAWTPAKWAAENGITSGTTATTFSPNDTCTRAQAVTFLWNAAGQPDVSGTCKFKDVSSKNWYYKAVLWAVANNITSGTSETTFSPNIACTRAQIVTFMWNEAGKPSVSGNCKFKDVSSSTWYYNAVLWAVQNNITSGTSATTFAPNAVCNRAQIVTFLYNYMGK